VTKKIKKLVLRLAFFVELIFAACFYFFGLNGLQALQKIEALNQNLKDDIELLNKEVKSLEQELNEWHTDSFYKEKIAREKLYFVYPYEELYLLKP
jgi:cell division protein FtsB